MRRKQVVLVTLMSFIFILLTACSSSDVKSTSLKTPVFASVPVTQASEGIMYTYQLATADAKDTFALSSAPTGATLSGKTISWTPTSAQSRVPNSFAVTATTPEGTSATQSWTVTPNGTVRITRVDTLWDESGSTDSLFDWSRISSFVVALVPQPDGSFVSLSGTPGAKGEFEIPNVPAGYYWLRLGPRDTYWTRSSTFDAGTDVFVSNHLASTPTNATTTFEFSFALEPTAVNGWLQFTSDQFALEFSGVTAAGSTNFTERMSINGNVDFSAVRNAFVAQYKQTTLGYLNGMSLGPELTLTNLSLKTGVFNAISGTLNLSVPAFVNLNVEASAWTPLLDHIAPVPPTAVGGGIYAYVQPYTAASSPNGPWQSTPISLIATTPANSHLLFTQNDCSEMSPSAASSNGFFVATALQPMTMDVDAGTVQYSDPFPAAWRRTFSVCQNAAIDVPVPGTSTTQSIVLTNSQTTSLPTETVKPLISPVQNAKVNGSDLFTVNTINSSAVTLSWNPPAIGAPFGYQVMIESPTRLPNGSVGYSSLATLSTATTSIKVPPDLLAPGHTYLFVISSLMDGRANMETSPHRSSLPVARADLISAPLTIDSTQSK